jgi:hypothetical protein
VTLRRAADHVSVNGVDAVWAPNNRAA